MLLDNVNNLDEFLLHYGDQLAAEARIALAPLHIASRDTPRLPPLLRKPYDPQAHVMAAAVKAIARRRCPAGERLGAMKSVNLIGEMGTGKTLMAEGTAHADALRRHANRWNHLVNHLAAGGRGKPDNVSREERRGAEAARTAHLRAHHAAVYDVGPVKMQAILATCARIKVGTFKHAGKEWKVAGERGGIGWPGSSHVYDVLVSAYPAGDKKTGKPTLFRCVCKGAYRALVVCPTVLLEKWQRELLETIPHAVVYMLDDFRQVLALADRWKNAGRHLNERREQLEAMSREDKVRYKNHRRDEFRDYPIGYEYYLIGRDAMKLSCGWKHAYVNRKWNKGRPINQGDYNDGLPACPTCGLCVTKSKSKDDPVDADFFGPKSSRRTCNFCSGPLWQEKAKPRRYSPSQIIKKRLRRFFDMTIFDEAHEYKSPDSLQADSIGGIAVASKRCMALTGTLVGGYAWHIRTILFRLGIAKTIISEGMGWKDKTAFDAKYGKMVTRQTIYPEDSMEVTSGYAHGRGGKKGRGGKIVKAEPGIVPTIFRHLIGNSVFLSLNEMSDNLPRLDEDVIESTMDSELRSAYDELDKKIQSHVREMIAKGNKKALGMMLMTLLSYPDYAWDWDEVGYWDTGTESLFDDVTGKPTKKRWVHVARPRNLDPNVMRNKERDCVEWVKGQVKKGHQVWLYGVFTNKRDFQPRFERWLSAEGLRVTTMRAGEVKPKDRERWIDVHGPRNQVILSHPELVKTGLDFFSRKTGHNYSSIGFFQTGYNLFTLRQASRRAWRLGQKRECETRYFYYENSMQNRAMNLMGKKIQAAQALEGNFSVEGLAAMAGEDGSVEMELAKSLVDKVDTSGGSRAWQKVTEKGVEAAHQKVDVAQALADIESVLAGLGITDPELLWGK